MYKWKQEPQDRIEEDRRHNDDTMVATKEKSDLSCRRKYSGDVVISAFREIEKSLAAELGRVWIHVQANRAWLTIGYGARVSGKKVCTNRLKYQVEVSDQTMKSSLCQMMGVGPQKEHSVGDEHEIAGDANGKNIDDITSKDIIDDFMSTFDGYTNKKTES